MDLVSIKNKLLGFFYGRWLLVFIFVVDLVILLLYLFKAPFIQIDNFTVLLLALLVVIPLTTQIKKLRWGEFEAEIGEKISKTTEKEAAKLSKKITTSKNPKVVKQNKELIQQKIDQFFKLGLQAGGYFKNRPYYQISNVRLVKDKDGREVLGWDEV